MVSRFFLDTEFSNGNFYLGDIFEIAVLSEDSGNIFHEYIDIGYMLPKYVENMCKINSSQLLLEGRSFKKVIEEFTNFIQHEANMRQPIIIAHGGFHNDFPLLITNCRKTGYNYINAFKNILFMDSVELLKKANIQNPGIDSIIKDLPNVAENVTRHTAVGDVQILSNIFLLDSYRELLLTGETYNLNKIEQYVNNKLPISISDIYSMAYLVSSQTSFEITLLPYCKNKSSLTRKQIKKLCIIIFGIFAININCLFFIFIYFYIMLRVSIINIYNLLRL